MKKTIAVISPDAVPLTLKENAPKFIKEGDIDYPIRDKCCRSTSPGLRAWETAKALADKEDNTVTLFIPDLNFPGLENIETAGLKFTLRKYNYKNTICDWSEELDRKLKTFDFVIVQATVGAGFKNCAVLPRSVNLIVDAWVPFPAELPCALLNHHKLKREHTYNKMMSYYNDLFMRANCILYANDRQRYLYEGYLFALGKLGWRAFKFAPLLKVPYGISKHDNVKRDTHTNKLRLLCWGAQYPWYQVEPLIHAVKNNPNIELDFVGAQHPRYRRFYDTVFKDYFSHIDDYQNIRVSTEYTENQAELFSDYSAGIIIGQNFTEETFAHRVRILEMASYGLNVLTNVGNVFTSNEYSEYAPLILGVDPNNLESELDNLVKNRDMLNYSNDQFNNFHECFNWGTVMSTVTDYVDQFGNSAVQQDEVIHG